MPDEPEGDSDTDWNLVGFVISSKYRIAVLKYLAERPATPSGIASDTGLPITHVSRALRTLQDRSLVELLVSKETKKGRIYGITERGQRLWRRIEAEGMVD